MKVEWYVDLSGRAICKTKKLRDEIAEKLKVALSEIEKEYDFKVWIEVEKIYETRWDCFIVRG